MTNNKGARFAAMRKAQEAKQKRDAERLVRERKVEAALAEFFEHTATVEQIEGATAARVAKVTAIGERKAAAAEHLAAVALRAMLDLGETRTAVAELTGLSLAAIRDAVADTGPAPASPVEPGPGSGRHTREQERQEDDTGDEAPAPYWEEGGDWQT
ncbi:hypothetical protein [Pilimelia columellifera]|uniref:Uncharacterized protein n=1 Tax=Pilimelia columellifera subsp. columellifera TaxID=706583 RepID=A0ABP6AU56_9ACTN